MIDEIWNNRTLRTSIKGKSGKAGLHAFVGTQPFQKKAVSIEQLAEEAEENSIDFDIPDKECV
ncbi:MAG: hypothetical protein ACLRIQ_20570 [Blautia wexlerae]